MKILVLLQEKELVADYDYVKELREKQKNKEKEESKKELETYKANNDQVRHTNIFFVHIILK